MARTIVIDMTRPEAPVSPQRLAEAEARLAAYRTDLVQIEEALPTVEGEYQAASIRADEATAFRDRVVSEVFQEALKRRGPIRGPRMLMMGMAPSPDLTLEEKHAITAASDECQPMVISRNVIDQKRSRLLTNRMYLEGMVGGAEAQVERLRTTIAHQDRGLLARIKEKLTGEVMP